MPKATCAGSIFIVLMTVVAFVPDWQKKELKLTWWVVLPKIFDLFLPIIWFCKIALTRIWNCWSVPLVSSYVFCTLSIVFSLGSSFLPFLKLKASYPHVDSLILLVTRVKDRFSPSSCIYRINDRIYFPNSIDKNLICYNLYSSVLAILCSSALVS